MVEILEELSPGDGVSFAKTGDKVVVHYTGTFQSSGEVFDCSRENGHAFTFQLGVGRVISGWDDGVARLSKGQRVKMLIGYQDAYGEKGQPPKIPPKADLIFDIELLFINETLVQEAIRVKREEQVRTERFLKLRDAELAAGAGAARADSGKAKKKKKRDERSSDSDSSGSSDSDSSEEERERKRRKKEKKEKKKERKKERKKDKKHDKDKKKKKKHKKSRGSDSD